MDEFDEADELLRALTQHLDVEAGLRAILASTSSSSPSESLVHDVPEDDQETQVDDTHDPQQ
jgi:hypothetical protein